MADTKPSSAPKDTWDFTYPIEKILKYKNSPDAWKLRWLESMRRLNAIALTDKQREFWKKVKNGEIG